MDFSALVEKYSPFIQKNLLVIVLGAVGLIFLSYGLIALLGAKDSSSGIVFESGETASESAKMQTKITVDVEGAVVKPGVHELSANSRLQDGLISAGGLSEDANREWVSKNLNLAAKLTDGGKIYIPKAGENSGGIGGSGSTGSLTTGQININSASESELDSLPGVGAVTAQKIISNRPYSSIEELLNKKVISSKVFSQIKEKIGVY